MYVHNLLIRLIVRHTLDVLSEIPTTVVVSFLHNWRRNVRVGDYWRGRSRQLARIYTQEMMSERRREHIRRRRRLVHRPRLSKSEIRALILLAESAPEPDQRNGLLKLLTIAEVAK